MISKDYLQGYGGGSTGASSRGMMTPMNIAKKTMSVQPNGGFKEVVEANNPWGQAVPPEYTYGGIQNLPPEWSFASNAYGQMFDQMGMPVDTSGIFDKAMAAAQPALNEKAAELAEQYGLSGLRWSEPLGDEITRETGRMVSNAALQQAMADIQAQEAGRSRMLPAVAGAAGMGDKFWNAPFQLSDAMMNQSAMYQAMNQSALDSYYRNAMNPYEQALMQMFMNTGHNLPMYPQSGWESAAGGAAPYLGDAVNGIINNLWGPPSTPLVDDSMFEMPGPIY